MKKRKDISLKQPEKPSTPKFLTFGKPDITEAEIEAVAAVMRSGWLSTGSVVNEFEKAFEKFIGEGYAVAVSSCTEALRLSLAVSNAGCGHEVITSPMTFAATANAILANDSKPVFVDVTSSGHMNPDEIERNITGKTKAIIPVHYTGASADLKPILELAEKYRITVIEDAAHSFDGEYVEPMSDKIPGLRHKIGTVSPYTCFSFYPTKNITCGEGGMVMCRNKDIAERIKTLSMQGLSSGAWKRYGSGPIRSYEVSYAGYKGNMTDIQAAIGLTQLGRWPEMKARRDAIWTVYEDAFGLKEPGHSKHLFTIRSPKRDQLRQHLYGRGIGTGIQFSPLHLEPGYVSLGYKRGDFPKAEKIGAETVSLPVSSTMTEDDAYRVVAAVKEFEALL
jgi:dTDP-4-amino-4,6-dideoxygalactose transaminase